MSQAGVTSQLGPVRRPRHWARAVVVVGVAAFVLAGVASVSAAKDKKDKSGFEVAATHYVTAEVDGQPHEVELLEVGDVTLRVQCGAWDASESGFPYPYGVGIMGEWSVTNNGDNPISFVGPEGPPTWLASGESTGGGGEWVNEGFPSGDSNSGLQSFAILDHGDTSATGMWAYSARVNEGDGDPFGECVFTVQAKG